MPALSKRRPAARRWSLSLFWRTFFLLALLLLGSIAAWIQTLRSLEFEPRARQTAQQIASLVNLSRAALVHADAINRISLLKTMAEQEGVRIIPREPSDHFEPFDADDIGQRIAQELQSRLGPYTVVTNRVNNESGLWVGFLIEGDSYWLLADRNRFNHAAGRTWLIWLMTAAALSLAGAAQIARLINRPLKQLSAAASRVSAGHFDASELDEAVATTEIRAVNIGFNRMTRKLAKIERDRAVMLAGISHDLRTPLARLRMETELGVSDDEAREHMADDITQLDAIIDKFLDYARPGLGKLDRVSLRTVIEAGVERLRHGSDLQIRLALPAGELWVQADAVELDRVLANLLENARRYGKSANSGVAEVEISASEQESWVWLQLRDHGAGVTAEQLTQLTMPFYRGEEARTAANGAGLGLAIVEKTLARMGATLELANASPSGLVANIKLQRATLTPNP